MSTSGQSNYIEEIKNLTDAIENDSSNSQLFFLRGNAYYNIQEFQKAINDYSVSIDLDSNYSFKVIHNRCCAYCKLNNYKKVIEQLFIMVEMNPSNDATYYCLGRAYKQQKDLTRNDFENAIKYYSKAIEINPLNSRALNERGSTYSVLGNKEQAIEDFTKSIQIEPNYDGCYYNRGLTYMNIKRYNDALIDLSKAIELNPNNTDAISKREKLRFEILGECGIYSLSDAVEKENFDAIDFYLDGIEDWRHRKCELKDWLLALSTAVKNKSYKIIDYFLSRDTKGDFIFSQSRKSYPISELHEAAKLGYLDIMKKFIEDNKVSKEEFKNYIEDEEYINLEDREGNTALLYAVENNHVDVVIYLIGKKANFTVFICETEKVVDEYEGYDYEFGYYTDTRDLYVDSRYEVSLLHKVYHNISSPMLKLLIQHGLDINDNGYKGKTVLHRACQENNLKIVKLLIEQGAMLSLTDSSMKTPLHYAKGKVYDYIVNEIKKS